MWHVCRGLNMLSHKRSESVSTGWNDSTVTCYSFIKDNGFLQRAHFCSVDHDHTFYFITLQILSWSCCCFCPSVLVTEDGVWCLAFEQTNSQQVSFLSQMFGLKILTLSSGTYHAWLCFDGGFFTHVIIKENIYSISFSYFPFSNIWGESSSNTLMTEWQ